MIRILVSEVLCLAIWYVTWGAFIYFLWLRGINYVHRYLITTLYFLLVGIGTVMVIRATIVSFFVPFVSTPFVILACFMIFQWILYSFAHSRLPKIPAYFATHPMREYLSFDPRRLLSKSADIFAQQIFILVLIGTLHLAGFSLMQTTLGFAVLFTLVHIPPLTKEWGSWPGWSFAGAVIVFSATFPSIILLTPYGFVYTFIIHWIFYTGMALTFWINRIRGTLANS